MGKASLHSTYFIFSYEFNADIPLIDLLGFQVIGKQKPRAGWTRGFIWNLITELCQECGLALFRKLSRFPVPYGDQSQKPLRFLRSYASLCTLRSKRHPCMSQPSVFLSRVRRAILFALLTLKSTLARWDLRSFTHSYCAIWSESDDIWPDWPELPVPAAEPASKPARKASASK